MKKVPFTPSEQLIMDKIAKEGEFSWQEFQKPFKFEKALKELMWRELVVRKRDDAGCLVANVFVATAWGNLSIKNNEAVESLKN